MLNFDFYNPTRILFGQGRVADIGLNMPADARVLILLGGASAQRSGLLEQVRSALQGRLHDTFGGIEPTPVFETCMRAVQRVREGRFDFLLAVGGAAVIDAAKFIAAAALFEGDPAEILRQHGRCIVNALPLGAMLTLPGLGSEVNDSATIVHGEPGATWVFSSPHTIARFAVLDPVQTYAMPASQLANGVVDIYARTMEQYLTYPVNAPVQDGFAEGLLRAVIEVGPRIVNAPEPVYDDRATLLWAANVARNGVVGVGVPQDWSTHAIARELVALHRIDNARALALVLPAMLHQRRQDKRAKLLQYAERVWGIRESDNELCIDMAIGRTRELFNGLGMPTRLSAYGLGGATVEAVVTRLQGRGMVGLGEHHDVTPEVSRRVLEAAL